MLERVCDGNPGVVEHAFSEVVKRSIGSSVLYSCDERYEQGDGDATISCQENKTWPTSDLVCIGGSFLYAIPY